MLRYIGMQNNPKHAILFLPAIESVYSDLSGQHAGWVFTGARWGNIGYLKIAEKLGKDAAPVIASMKRLLPDVKKRAKSRDSKLFQGILKSAEKTIQDYEKKYGAVEP
jgi:hypothetical protein